MLRFEHLFWALFFALFLYLGEGEQAVDRPPRPVVTLPEPVKQQIAVTERKLEIAEPGEPRDADSLEILPIGLVRYADDIQHMLAGTPEEGSIFVYSYPRVGEYIMSAQSVSNRQHLVNSYLEGFKPFDVDNVFLPMQVLARRKTYQYDHLQYPGHPDVWQSSRQAFYYTRGDCEDHALALTDWLIAMGEDARVALGTVKDGGGHAWVVLFKDGKEYVLEATQKRGLRRLRAYPLAKLRPEYRPEYMFNREYFWTNNGSALTTSYSSRHWQKKSRLTHTHLDS